MKEIFFKVVPMSAPLVDIGIKPPIISGIAYIKNFYETIFYYWNGKEYTRQLDFIEDIRSKNKYYDNSVYAGIDEFLELALYGFISAGDVAGGVIQEKYLDYNIILAGAGGDS